MFKVLENWKILDLEVLKYLNTKWIISKQIIHSQTPQQAKGAFKPISGLTGLCFLP